MAIPNEYNWLTKESGPIMIKKALELFDTKEILGRENNPVILAWGKEIGGNVENVYKADEIPWCGLFMAVVAKRASKQIVKDPLWALNWGTFGKYVENPMLGDVLVFVRKTPEGKTAGHVGLYVGEDATSFHVLGGNQSDKVCFARIERDRLYASRRPNYNIVPQNVRKVVLKNSGNISVNEQ